MPSPNIKYLITITQSYACTVLYNLQKPGVNYGCC